MPVTNIFRLCFLLGLFNGVYPFDCIKHKGIAIDAKLTTPMNWIKDAINAHNLYRFEHGAEPLVFNESLCLSAQWTANTNAEIGFMHTSQMPGGYSISCGENLYKSASGKAQIRPGHEPVDSWYSEESDYDYQKGASKALHRPVGHFTQLVWKASKQVCIAYTIKGTNFFVAAHYFPRGNVRKRYIENVGVAKNLIPKPKVEINAWMELLCNKMEVKGRRFKCHYKGLFSQISPPKKFAISTKESRKLFDRLLLQEKLTSYLGVPAKGL